MDFSLAVQKLFFLLFGRPFFPAGGNCYGGCYDRPDLIDPHFEFAYFIALFTNVSAFSFIAAITIILVGPYILMRRARRMKISSWRPAGLAGILVYLVISFMPVNVSQTQPLMPGLSPIKACRNNGGIAASPFATIRSLHCTSDADVSFFGSGWAFLIFIPSLMIMLGLASALAGARGAEVKTWPGLVLFIPLVAYSPLYGVAGVWLYRILDRRLRKPLPAIFLALLIPFVIYGAGQTITAAVYAQLGPEYMRPEPLLVKNGTTVTDMRQYGEYWSYLVATKPYESLYAPVLYLSLFPLALLALATGLGMVPRRVTYLFAKKKSTV